MKNEETYSVNRSDYTRQETWIAKLLASRPALLGFFVQFQSCFGRSAAVRLDDRGNPTAENKGLFLSQPRIAALMEAEGCPKDRKTIQRNLAELVELGIISKAPVADPANLDHTSKRIVWIYLINKTRPFEYDDLVKELAHKEWSKSPYKNQAKNSKAKKAREAKEEESVTTEAALEAESALHEGLTTLARALAKGSKDEAKAASLVRNHFVRGGTAEEAIKALKDIRTKDLPMTQTCFEFGTKSFDVYLNRHEEQIATAVRDELSKLRHAYGAEVAQDQAARIREQMAQAEAARIAEEKALQALREATPDAVLPKRSDEEVLASLDFELEW